MRLSAALACLCLSLGVSAAPVPFPKPARQMRWAEAKKWLTADRPIVMEWGGVDYPVTFAPAPAYHAATTHSGRFLWHGEWWLSHDGEGQVSVTVHEWAIDDAGRGEAALWFRFPMTIHRDGRVGGAMGADAVKGGRCWLRRVR